MEIGNSKMNQIESLAETLKHHFMNLDPLLDSELEKLLGLIKEERERNKKVSELAQIVANRI